MNSERCSQCKHFIIANAGEGKIYGCDRSKCVFEPITKNDLGVQMTNGEKMISAFPNGEVRMCEKGVVFSTGGWCHAYAEEWWNAEYKEPTTKNDLGAEHHKQNIQAYAHDFGVPEEQAEKELRVTIKNDLADDCISRKAVFETIDDCNHDGLKGIFCSYDDGERFKKYIKNLPPVTPQPRKGHWIRRNAFLVPWKCSECNYESERYENYCPNCGADMREVEE